MDWFLSGLMIFINILLGKKIKWAWVLMAVSSILWIIYALILTPPQYGLIPSAALNFIIAVFSSVKWFKEDLAYARR